MAIPFILNNPTAFVYVAPPSPDAPGIMWMWGSNNYGQLGQGDTANRSTPTSVAGHSFTKISLGRDTAFGIDQNGLIWSWGYNASTYFDLGVGDQTNRSNPTSMIGGHSFADLNAGTYGGNALKADGSLWSWGILNTPNSSPTSVAGGHSFTKISRGRDPEGGNPSLMALKADGTAWGYGNNGYYQLGDGTNTARTTPVAVLGGHSFAQIESNDLSSHALKADGSAWSWGYGGNGQIGDNTNTDRSTPVSVVGGHSFIQLAAGWRNVFALKADGSVWAWGGDWGFGAFGTTPGSGNSPKQIQPASHSFVQIAATGSGNQNSVMGRKADGTLWAWGNNNVGQLGNGTTTNSSTPVSVSGGSYARIARASGDGFHFAAIKV